MDTITHTLFGVIMYRSVNKIEMSKELKRSLLFTSLVGSQIPDIDVISQLWDTQGMYQMWHRGITHSIFMVPIWALLLSLICFLVWRTKDKRIFFLGLLAVFIHDTSDIFNAWGTGYFEPFSQARLTFGTIPIIDLTIWAFILGGFIFSRVRKHIAPHKVFKGVWCLIAAHILIQSVQGYAIYQSVDDPYEQVALSAEFVPWNYQVIGKRGDVVEILDATLWSEPKLVYTLQSSTKSNLDELFKKNPAAKTLHQWSPFVVIVDDEKHLGIYDPRFYRNGQSFLFESIEKNTKGAK
ncbi:inner membrane protein [Tumebacillus sp. BK434]|uniref:metal-dependent hydrolase n=1 Tax=Tumebacillus sp. BK434 TaxID=2512169 RepID=UPI0010438198|nr:metal-dependent hydrolase [Tumebacillus sp. BK434]TCP54628.1 inner membrane protein [Tumebacillus sp. BK434]